MTTPCNSLTSLMSDPMGRPLGFDLPPGSLVTDTYEGPWHEPLLWCCDKTAGHDDWAQFLPAREAAGLQPVLLQDEQGLAEWWTGKLSPGVMSAPGDHEAEEVLASFWAEALSDADDDEGEDEAIAPFSSSWPGLARAGHFMADPDVNAARVAANLIAQGWLATPRFGLVPAGRSADIPAAIGWSGPVNDENDVARLCAVLRSWEDRFGIRVVALSYDRLDLAVAAPPQTMEEALAIAAEHFAFCPDSIWQGYDTIRLYAKEALLGKHHWTFWWD